MDIVISGERVAEAVDLIEYYRLLRDKYAGHPPGTVGGNRYRRYAMAVIAVENVLDTLGIAHD